MFKNLISYLLLFCIVPFTSLGQESDTLNSSGKLLDRFELEAIVSLHECQEFNTIPGYGGQVSVFAPFYNDRLRLGLGVGMGKQTFSYELSSGWRRVGPVDSYSPELNACMLNIDLTIGTNFLPKSKVDLVLSTGFRMNNLLSGNYRFTYNLFESSTDHSFDTRYSIHPGLVSSLSLRFPLSEKSSIGFIYSFSYSFLQFKLKPNSSSNDLYYQMDRFGQSYFNETEDLIIYLPYYDDPAPHYLVYQRFLELPSNLGGQHSFSISYRYTLDLSRKKSE